MSAPPPRNSRLVYSTDGGRAAYMGNRKPAPKAPGPGAQPTGPSVPDDGIVRVHRQKAGRGGKTATLITGLPGTDAELDAILKALKAQCGTGGAREGRVLVIQGDLRERLVGLLEARGFNVKVAGG